MEVPTSYTAMEVTGHFKVHVPDRDKETISLKLKGANHRDSEYNACCNIHFIPFKSGEIELEETEEGWESNFRTIGKQCPHNNYKVLGESDDDYSSPKPPMPKFELGDIREKWIGVKAIEWNEGEKVHWQTWIDENCDNNWKCWIDFLEAEGSIGDDDDTETI